MIVRFGDCINFLSSILQVNLYCYSKKMWAISTVLLQNFVKVCFIVKNFMIPLKYYIKLSLVVYKFTNCLNLGGRSWNGLYVALHWLYFTLLHSTFYHVSTSVYLTLHYSTMTLFHSTWFYIIRPWLYFTQLDFALIYQCSTSTYMTLPYSTMALLHSTWLYITLPWLYFTLLDSTSLYYMALLHCT